MKIQAIVISQPSRETDVIASHVSPDKDFFALHSQAPSFIHIGAHCG
jgi:hypothetical protein